MAKDKEYRREKKENKKELMIGSYQFQSEVSWIQHIFSSIAHKNRCIHLLLVIFFRAS